MKVLSLFDGISCGRESLERAGIQVDEYFASEIEPNAMKISKKNYPEIIQMGDITQITEEMLDEIMPVDLVIGGSPCQDLSVYKFDRGEANGLEGKKSSLFYHYERILKYVKPTYFLLENVPMQKEWEDIITELLGVAPIMINSNLVCAADRKRLYWTNIQGIQQPKDKGILLKDVMVSASEVPEKYWYNKPFEMLGENKKIAAKLELNAQRHCKEVYSKNFKCSTLTCVSGGYQEKKVFQDGRCRKLLPVEYERLQTLPDGYTEGIADSKRYTTIGNGWTVDVIAHIFSFLPDEYKKGESKEMELKMNEYQLPEKISFNYEELKQELMNKVEMYTNLVYTEEQIGDAKKDKANLNKLKKALNDERIRLQKEYMEPFNVFKGQIDEIISIIDKPVLLIDKQVKEYEEKQKDEKMAAIEDLFASIGFQDFVRLDMIFDNSWLNKSTSMKKIEEAMKSEMYRIGNDILTLSKLPEFGFEATQIYKSTLDVNKAISEAQRMAEMQKKKAEHEAEMKARAEEQARLDAEAEAKKQEEAMTTPADLNEIKESGVYVAEHSEGNMPEQVSKQWISFSALLSTEDALALKDFFNSRNIEFKAI